MLIKIFVLIYNLFFLHIIKYWKLLQIMNYKKEQIYLFLLLSDLNKNTED